MRQLRILALLPCLLAASTASTPDLLIENVTVVSPEQAQPLAGRHVLIRDGRIVTVSRRAIAVKADTRRIDGRGKFLTPGVMDSHVHVSDAAGISPVSDDPAIVALRETYFRQQPRSYLYFGVTQVLDLLSFGSGLATFESQPQRPDLFHCGAAIVLDGYPMLYVDRPLRYRAFPDYVFEPANAKEHPLPAGADAAQHTPEFVVEKFKRNGARCVKAFIEDGFGPRAHWPMMSTDTLARLRTAARKHGLTLLAHANARDMQRIALDAGVDVLAHGVWDWTPFDAPEGVPAPIAAHLREVHTKRIGYQATLRVMPATADLFRADTLTDPMYAKVVPPAVLAWYASDAGQWFKRSMLADSRDGDGKKIADDWLEIAGHGMRAVRFLHELGHPLLLASDTPSAPTYGNQPGYDTYREMQLMAQAGIPLHAILEAATLSNARQFGLDRDYGTVQPGKIANLLLLDANPLVNVRAWSQIDKIILHGAVIERATLAADAKAAP